MPIRTDVKLLSKRLVKSESKLHSYILIGFAILFICFFAYNFNHGERIQFNNGLGWDGADYADWAQRHSAEILNSKTVPAYYIGRILPSITIHNICELIGHDIKSTARVIHAFYIYNFILITISSIFLILIGRHYKWRNDIYLLAFTAIFFNYPVLKNYSYNPTLVDISVLTISITIFYFYIKDKIIPLSIMVFIGCFVWPTMIYGTLPLLIFGRTKIDLAKPQLYAKFLAIGVGTTILAYAGYLYTVEGLRQTIGTTPINFYLLPISATLLIGYIAGAIYPFITPKAYIQAIKKTSWLRILIGLTIFFSVKHIIGLFAAPSGDPLTIKSYIGLLTQASLSNPLVNVVAHAMHYGLFYLLIIIYWKDFTELVKEHGLGLVFFIGLFSVLSMGAESRQFINAWPIFAILICQVLNKKWPLQDWSFSYSMAILGIILSRCWLDINVGPWTGSFQTFPDQMLYMYSGPWMSPKMYAVFLSITIICLITIHSLLRNKKLEQMQSIEIMQG
jgi:hypothetical protein